MMNDIYRSFFRIAFLALILIVTGCDSNDSDSGSVFDLIVDDPTILIGTYDIVSMTDKIGEQFGTPGQKFEAGEKLNVTVDGVSVTVLLEGTLVLTDHLFTFRNTIAVTWPGLEVHSEIDEFAGSYTVIGNTLTTFSDVPGGGEVSDLSIYY